MSEDTQTVRRTFSLDVKDGRLPDAQWVPSPNFGQRPPAAVVSLLVIHNISLPPGQFGSGCIQRFFSNQLAVDEHPYFAEIDGLQVSSHLLIERDGTLYQFVNFNDRAWHAGVSCYEGLTDCNDFSIGIELEGCDNTPYSEAQYQVLTRVTIALRRYYPMIGSRIAGHDDIAPGRKTDPGPAFDWGRYLNSLKPDEYDL
ncbi:1,6-anhydro-N-acetylmuramyl-L-alanine amidase AmpD [Oceanobacter sp. wDCs-4]|uniref:1,6-anhydro-N-acetylmuramyl-L-alanine amidase AmpD n=1 Tax=Oceanobacter antarcticus TaxID=3133425 RepID=A0ABW8NDK1_9GAMM|tara:strand:- start:550 stop:1146 length:597 start_codon:yes stop_codon:yes gene_type:complete